jgi:phosphatidylglycerophosphatase A
MKLNPLEKFLGSGFYTGYFPYASGTVGSAAALLIYWIPGFERIEILLAFTVLAIVSGLYIGGRFEAIYGKDPAEFTLDEVAGMWITLLFLPKTFLISIAGFALWRILDILKPFPANAAEKLPGGLGIMLDDIIASVYACLIMHISLQLFNI